jgi:AcrR family transcriptional regulator
MLTDWLIEIFLSLGILRLEKEEILGDLLEQTKESKDKILKAAEELFSNNGFDGTSVNSIAEKAGVNKALIYYYFKSKDEILQSLFDSLIKDITEVLISDVIKEMNFIIEGKFFTDEFIDRMMLKYLDFFVNRRTILRVMVAESLKKGENGAILFKFTDFLNSEQVKSILSCLEEKGIKTQLDNNSMSVGKFFLGFIPIINYAIYYDEWKSHYNMGDEEFRKTFINIYKMSYDGYKNSLVVNKYEGGKENE